MNRVDETKKLMEAFKKVTPPEVLAEAEWWDKVKEKMGGLYKAIIGSRGEERTSGIEVPSFEVESNYFLKAVLYIFNKKRAMIIKPDMENIDDLISIPQKVESTDVQKILVYNLSKPPVPQKNKMPQQGEYVGENINEDGEDYGVNGDIESNDSPEVATTNKKDIIGDDKIIDVALKKYIVYMDKSKNKQTAVSIIMNANAKSYKASMNKLAMKIWNTVNWKTADIELYGDAIFGFERQFSNVEVDSIVYEIFNEAGKAREKIINLVARILKNSKDGFLITPTKILSVNNIDKLPETTNDTAKYEPMRKILMLCQDVNNHDGVFPMITRGITGQYVFLATLLKEGEKNKNASEIYEALTSYSKNVYTNAYVVERKVLEEKYIENLNNEDTIKKVLSNAFGDGDSKETSNKSKNPEK